MEPGRHRAARATKASRLQARAAVAACRVVGRGNSVMVVAPGRGSATSATATALVIVGRLCQTPLL
jgi:hypothetical protein